MVRLAIVFLILAMIAAFLGFGGVAQLSWEGAKLACFALVALALLAFLGGAYRKESFWR